MLHKRIFGYFAHSLLLLSVTIYKKNHTFKKGSCLLTMKTETWYEKKSRLKTLGRYHTTYCNSLCHYFSGEIKAKIMHF